MGKQKRTKSAKPAKAAKPQLSKYDRKIDRYLIAFPVVAFLIKLIVMKNAPGGGWLGADGENYLHGVDGMLKDGFFSKEHLLVYWPAGYPTLIFGLTKISLAHIIWLLSFVQSVFFAYSTYYFTKAVRNSSLAPIAFSVSFIISFNPTLSLSSLAVGYETPIASSMMMIAGYILKSRQFTNSENELPKESWKWILGAGGFFALSSFMQPRWLLTTVVTAILWGLLYKNRKNQALVALGVCGVMAVAPMILIVRNISAGNGAVISTNLGVTMRIGAGDQTQGGYGHIGPEVPCKTGASDNEVVKCVIKWYATHPVKTAELAFNKTMFFWSPWTGPFANGTMARNPSLKVSPVVNFAQTSQVSHDFSYGVPGKVISWLWTISGIALLFIGFVWIRTFGPFARDMSWILLSPVLVSWIVSLGTIGDHRFRIPTMSLSLFLQVAGFLGLRNRVKTGSFALALESSAKAR